MAGPGGRFMRHRGATSTSHGSQVSSVGAWAMAPSPRQERREPVGMEREQVGFELRYVSSQALGAGLKTYIPGRE